MARPKKEKALGATGETTAPAAPATPAEQPAEAATKPEAKEETATSGEIKLPAGFKADGKTFQVVAVKGGSVVVNPRGIRISGVLELADAGKLARDMNFKAKKNKLDF